MDQGPWSDLTRAIAPVTNGVLGNVQIALADGNYALRVQAKDAVGLATSALVHVRLDRTPPPTPSGLVAQVVQNRDVQLNWTAVSAADLAGYIIYRSGVRVTANPVATPAYLDAQAPEGTLSYQISAIDIAGNESPRSAPATAIIDHTPPAASISNPLSNSRVRATLDIDGTAYSAGDFKDYNISVQAIVPPGASTPIVQSSVPVNVARLGQWDTTTVTSETQVRITLSAEDVHGNAATSSVDVTVDNQPPSAPTGLHATASGANVLLSWNANTESDLLGYVLYRNGELVGWSGNPPTDLRGAASQRRRLPIPACPTARCCTSSMRSIRPATSVHPRHLRTSLRTAMHRSSRSCCRSAVIDSRKRFMLSRRARTLISRRLFSHIDR